MSMLRDDAAVRAAGNAAWQKFWLSPPDRQHHTSELLSIYARVLARDRISTDRAA